MTRKKLIEKYPTLFLECVREGIELCLYGMTDINSVEDIEKYNEEIKRREIEWGIKSEDELLQLII